MIREGEGRAALELYRSEERVTVAPDAEARREAMVADWHRAYQEGQDALMVAKRNAEVERLNATARELLRAEGQLGEQEIEVGEARFAAGDQVITRVNDHAAEHLQPRALAGRPRSIPSRAASSSRASTRQRTVEVGPDYLSRTTPHGEAPALQHAYAVTTYCAQGSDRRPRLRDGRPLDGQAGAVRRHLAQPRGDLSLRHAGDPGRARRVRAEAARARRHRPRREKRRCATAPRRRRTTRRCARSFARCRPPRLEKRHEAGRDGGAP